MATSKNQEQQSTALVPVTERFVALAGGGAGSALAVIRENLGSEALSVTDLERIKVPTGGGKFFDVGGAPVAKLAGVVLFTQAQRAYWDKSFDETGGKEPPTCYSPDQLTGVGDPGGDCMTCPLAQFGSARKGAGQACRAFRSVYMLLPSMALPVLVTVPPTSLKNFRDYLVKKLGNANLRPMEVETELALEQDKSGDGIVYSKITATPVRPLELGEREAVLAYAKAILPHLERATNRAAAGAQREAVAGKD